VPDHIEFKRRGELAGVGDEGFESVLAATTDLRIPPSCSVLQEDFPVSWNWRVEAAETLVTSASATMIFIMFFFGGARTTRWITQKERGNKTRGHNMLGHTRRSDVAAKRASSTSARAECSGAFTCSSLVAPGPHEMDHKRKRQHKWQEGTIY
jgi:hypothetical protein